MSSSQSITKQRWKKCLSTLSKSTSFYQPPDPVKTIGNDALRTKNQNFVRNNFNTPIPPTSRNDYFVALQGGTGYHTST